MLLWALCSAEGNYWTREFRREVANAAIGIGNLWAIVVAVGLFADDLESRLHTFWRSRPIRPTTWFWGKYLIGAFSILVMIDVPAVALGVYDQHPARELFAFLCVTLQHLASFSMAVMAICLIRHVVCAGVLGMCGMLFVTVLPLVNFPAGTLPWLKAFRFGLQRLNQIESLANHGMAARIPLVLLPYLLSMLAISILATCAARWAIKRDFTVNV